MLCFFHSFVVSKVRKVRSEKRGGAKDRLPKMSKKFAPRLRARANRKSKPSKTGMPGALLEVELRKICTTPARKSESEDKIVKNWHAGSTFGSCASQNLHHACARERFGTQNRSKLAVSEHFWKLSFAKFAPRLRTRAIRKSKSLKTGGVGASQNLHHACARERFGSQNR